MQTHAVRHESAPGWVPTQLTSIWHSCGTRVDEMTPLPLFCSASRASPLHPIEHRATDCPSTHASINKVNLRRAQLVPRWWPYPGSIPGAGHLFRYVTNQTPTTNSAFHPSRVGKWVPVLAGKVHSVSGCTRGVQVKLWDPLRTHAIPERFRGVFTTRRYTNPRLPLLVSYWKHRGLLKDLGLLCYTRWRLCWMLVTLRPFSTSLSDRGKP